MTTPLDQNRAHFSLTLSLDTRTQESVDAVDALRFSIWSVIPQLQLQTLLLRRSYAAVVLLL